MLALSLTLWYRIDTIKHMREIIRSNSSRFYPIEPSERRVSFGARVGAFVIDSFIGGFASLFVTGLVSTLTQNEFFLGLTWLATYLTYQAGFLSSLGATPGKAIAGLEVVDAETGKRLSFCRSVLRCMSYLVSMSFSYLGFLWALWDRNQQAWHDKIASTVVIQRTPFQIAPPSLSILSIPTLASPSYRSLEKTILKLAQSRGGRLTVTEVSANTDLSLNEAKLFLERLVDQGYVEIEISPSGMFVYRFFEVIHEDEKAFAKSPASEE